MKLTKSFLLLLVFACLLYACSQKNKEAQSISVPTQKSSRPSNTETDISVDNGISSTAAVVNDKDTSHKFVRTADLKFKVKNVVSTTYSIENIVTQQGGFVTYTNLSSTVNNRNSVAVSADSSLETTYYTVENTMTIRVPNTRLDTTLKSLAPLIDYIDFRTIKANDVALQLLANKLEQERMEKSGQRLMNAIDNRGRKLEETSNAEESLLAGQAQRDRAKISNFSLNDEINFSTLTLALYQREAVLHELVANDKNLTAFRPPLSTRLADAFSNGWQALASLLVFFAEIWWLLLLLPLAYMLYKKIDALMHVKRSPV